MGCETKCKKLRDCKRHPCNRKCCVECQPCEQPCGKTLNCKNHKCTSRCHTGSCYPCQLYQKITCNCGETSYSVPCGREKTARPPKCKKVCKIPSNCHHLGSNKQHNCHTGPCPKCKELCGKSLSCGHVCNAPCHENVKTRVEENGKAALPWEVRGPQFVIKSQPCPPCEVPVDVTCLGGHETVAYPCHMAKPASCGRKCGRELPCGNHTCLRECHRVRGAESDHTAGTNCKKCELECTKPRPKGCTHPCTIQKCHPGECPDCVSILKIRCHCTLTNVFVKCSQYLMSSRLELETLLCCKDQCPKMLECGHRCTKTCHTGTCSPVSECKKKMKIFCKCKRKKEEFRCNQAFGKENLVICDDECHAARKSSQKENHENVEESVEDARNRKEAELFERQMAGAKKRRKPRAEVTQVCKPSIFQNKTLIFAAVSLAVISSLTYVAFN